jgi:hypothetical protein
LIGSLPGLLRSSSTETGVAVFVGFWMTTTVCTMWELRNRPEKEDGDIESRLEITCLAGALNGLLVFVPVAVKGMNNAAKLAASGHVAGQVLPGVIVFSGVAAVVAFIVGGVVGALYAMVESTLMGLADVLVRWSAGDE